MWRPVTRFLKRHQSRDGYDSICKECRNEMSRAWRVKNKDRVHELNQRYYAENLEERKAYNQRYRQNNQGYFRHYYLKFRQTHTNYHRDYMRAWCRRNREKVVAKDHARRAAKLRNGGSFTYQEWEELKRHYKYTCLRCGRQEPDIQLTVDHVIPLHKGGSNFIENIQPLCKPCNSAKHTKATDYRLSTSADEE